MPNPGFFTPSTFADIMSNGRGGQEFGKMAQKVIDRMTLDLLGVERPEESTPPSCQWGLDHEWEAIQEYEERTFRKVMAPVEFRASKSHPYVGGTMDGLVGQVGGIEVKSPYDSMNHLYNIQTSAQLYKDYWYQVQGYFWIFELEWIDFISYDPRFPKPSSLYIKREYPDEAIISKLKERCEKAHRIAQKQAERLRDAA